MLKYKPLGVHLRCGPLCHVRKSQQHAPHNRLNRGSGCGALTSCRHAVYSIAATLSLAAPPPPPGHELDAPLPPKMLPNARRKAPAFADPMLFLNSSSLVAVFSPPPSFSLSLLSEAEDEDRKIPDHMQNSKEKRRGPARRVTGRRSGVRGIRVRTRQSKMSFPLKSPDSFAGRSLSGEMDGALCKSPGSSPKNGKRGPRTEADLAYPVAALIDMKGVMSGLPASKIMVPSPPAGSVESSMTLRWRGTAPDHGGAFRTSLPFPPSHRTESLILREKKEVAGVYGIGLKIDNDPPHSVQQVHQLLDVDGSNIGHRCAVGDVLTFVDDSPLEKNVRPTSTRRRLLHLRSLARNGP